MTAPTSWADALSATLLAAAILGAPTPSRAQSCDPTRQSCVPPGGGSGGGTGGGSGGGTGSMCIAPPGGNPGSTPNCGSGPAARSSSAPSTAGGNPINLVSGNKYQQEIDMPALPGVLGLELVRHYNSLDAHRGLTGANWRTSYEAVLYDFGRSLQIVQADGRRLMFERPASQSKITSSATHELCTAADPADGQVRIEQDAQGRTSYHWRWSDGRTLVFGQGHNGGHPLQGITAASGEQLTLTYAPSGELVAVRDPQGRTLRFVYDAQRQLGAIQTPVTELRYRRDAQYRLIEASTVAQDKTIATRRYHHEAERQSGHANALTGISLVTVDQGKSVEQRLSTYAYDARGRATLSTKGLPKLRPEISKDESDAQRGIEQIEVQYIEPPLPRQHKLGKDGELLPAQTGLTILTNSLGHKSRIKSAIVAGSYRLIEFTGVGCSTCPEPNKRYGYNAVGQLVSEHALDAKGNVQSTQRFEYDSYGRLTREIGARAFERYEYQDTRYPDGSIALGQQPVVIARPSVMPGKEHVTRIAYNEHGQPRSVTEQGFSPIDDKGEANATPIARTTNYTYSRINGHSVLTHIDGPLPNGPKSSPEDSDIINLQWDERGNFIVGSTQPMSLVARMTYDEVGRLAQFTDADGLRTLWFYGAYSTGQPSGTVRAGMATGYAYDALSRVRAVADTAGRGIALGYDAAGRLTTVTDAQGYRQELALDSEGKVQRAGQFEPDQLLPLRAAHRFYDAQQRLTKHLLPDGRVSAYTYDDSIKGQGRLIEHLDGDDVLHLHRRDAQGQAARIDLTPDGLLRVALSEPLQSPTSPDSGAEAPYFRRDDFGRPVLQWRPEQGLQTRVFDAAGRLVRELQRNRAGAPAGHIEQRFDAAGRIVERSVFDAQAQRVQTARTTYRGQRIDKQSDDAQDTRYEYDAAGRISHTRITLKDEQGNAAYVTTLRTNYDAQGQPQSKTLADGQVMRIDRHAATGVARRITLQQPLWAKLHDLLEQWVPQGAAQTVQAWLPWQTVVSDIDFHPYKGVTGLTHGNGMRSDKQFDIAGRLTAIKTGEQTTRYGYGAGPKIRKIDDQALRYNGWGSLQEQATPRIIKTAATTAAIASAARIEYDGLGRVINDGINRYTFTADGQVHTVSTQDGQPVARYRYNALRQRVSKTVHGANGERTTYYLWQHNKLVAEIDGNGDRSGQISTQYLYLSEDGKAQPLAKLETAYASGNLTGKARTLAIHANHRGEPIAMSDERQRVVWKTRSDAWGHVDAAQMRAQSAELNLRLPGQYFDAESGLHDNWHRSYDPRPASALKGRYLSPDPLGYPDGDDPYAYVNGDPINRVDPTGLYEEDVHYYLTFFLALVAGLPDDAARTIALGTQFIDENPLTRPLSTAITPNSRALPLYHFTRTREMDRTTDATTRINNPTSPQLENLRRPAMNETLPSCARQQLFGEYLHAFEDAFSHRDQNNVPFFFTSTAGHGAYNHDPDQTYNVRDFQNNEMRTMRMAQEVYEQIQSLTGSPTTRSWSEIQSTVLQFVRTGQAAGNAAPRWQDSCFGGTNPSCDPGAAAARHRREAADKAAVLEARLVAFGLVAVGDLNPANGRLRYDGSEAGRRRQDNLRGLTHAVDPTTGLRAFPGVLLPGD